MAIKNIEDFVCANRDRKKLQELINKLNQEERVLERILSSELSRFVSGSRRLLSNNPLFDYCVAEFNGEKYDGISRFNEVIEKNMGNYIGFSEGGKINLKGMIAGQLEIYKINECRLGMAIPLKTKLKSNKKIVLPHELSKVIVNYLDKVSIDIPSNLIGESASGLLNAFYDNERKRDEKRKKVFEELKGTHGVRRIVFPPYLSENMNFFIAKTEGGHTGPLIGVPGYEKTVYQLQVGKE